MTTTAVFNVDGRWFARAIDKGTAIAFDCADEATATILASALSSLDFGRLLAAVTA